MPSCQWVLWVLQFLPAPLHVVRKRAGNLKNACWGILTNRRGRGGAHPGATDHAREDTGPRGFTLRGDATCAATWRRGPWKATTWRCFGFRCSRDRPIDPPRNRPGPKTRNRRGLGRRSEVFRWQPRRSRFGEGNKGTVPFSSDENWDSPPIGSRPRPANQLLIQA